MMAGAGILSQEALQTIGKLSRPNALWDKDEGEVFLLNKIYEDYIREKVHEQLIEMAKRMLEDNALSLLSKNDEVLETSMDDIEIQIVKDYLKKNRKFLEE